MLTCKLYECKQVRAFLPIDNQLHLGKEHSYNEIDIWRIVFISAEPSDICHIQKTSWNMSKTMVAGTICGEYVTFRHLVHKPY